MPRRRLLAVCALAIVPAFAACGGDDDDDSGALPDSTATQSQSAVQVSTAAPVVGGPASKYAISIDDIGIAWLTDIRQTLVIDMESYAKTGDVFETPGKGRELLRDWGYSDGYQTAFIPEGRDEAVLLGSYYIVVETHRFESEAGARKAYEYYKESITSAGAPPNGAQLVGNRSIGFTGYGAKVPGSTVNTQFEQLIFQRGNVVAIVLATGAQGFMKTQHAWDLAVKVDEKILGVRPAIEPTPVSNYKTPTPAPKQ
jgi:hypothetical protein